MELQTRSSEMVVILLPSQVNKEGRNDLIGINPRSTSINILIVKLSAGARKKVIAKWQFKLQRKKCSRLFGNQSLT